MCFREPALWRRRHWISIGAVPVVVYQTAPGCHRNFQVAVAPAPCPLWPLLMTADHRLAYLSRTFLLRPMATFRQQDGLPQPRHEVLQVGNQLVHAAKRDNHVAVAGDVEVSLPALTAQSGRSSRRHSWFGAPVQSHRIKRVPSLGSPPATSRHLPARPRRVPSRAGVQF